MNEFKDKLIQKIQTGEISMRPKWHFMLKAGLLLVSVVLVALIAVYLFSFLLFTLHRSGLIFAPQFGWHGVMMFIVASPWLLISILGIFLLILFVLVSHYSFSYQKPLVYSVVGLVLLVISASSFIQYLGIHDRMQSFSDRHNIPGLRPLYNDPVDRRPPGIETGEIIEITKSGFILKSERGEELNIIITNRTKTPPSLTLVENLEVTVFGERKDKSITAFGVKTTTTGGQIRINDLNGPPPRH